MKKIFEKIGHRGVIIIASVLLGLFFFFFPLTRQIGELRMYDLRLAWFRSPDLNPNIQVISIDQTSLDKYGAFPWKRSMYGKIIETLKERNPQILIFDILFQEPKPEDEKFADAIKNAGFPIILSSSFSVPDAINQSHIIPVVENLEKASSGTGFINYPSEDPDGKYRRAALAVNKEGTMIPSLDLVTFARLKGVSPGKISYGSSSITVGDKIIPTDKNYCIYINYYFPKVTGGMIQTFPSRSFAKFLEDPKKIPPLDGKILILGAGSAGMQDDFPTPVEGKTFGTIIHANTIDTLLQGKFLRRAPDWLNLGVVLVITLLYGLFISRFYSLKNIALASIGLVVIYSAINFTLFKYGYWLDLVPPLFAVFSCSLVVLGMQFFRTHKLFQQFVVPEVVNQMVSSDEHSKLGGVEKEVSILFSDIRGYTSLSEKMTPSQVMEMLNEYHTEMVHLFEKNHGRVIDYMGDAQMVVFGAPVELADHAVWACRAALDTQKALENLCNKWHVENRTSFEVGVGICTGTVAIGLVGAEGHKQYTVIGDSTNVASRLQGQSKILGAPIIISPRTVEMVQHVFDLKALGHVDLKGKSEPMEVFTVIKEKESAG